MMLSGTSFSGEMDEARSASARLTKEGIFKIGRSCVVGTAISFSGLWVQKHISATIVLVYVNVNELGTIFVEAFLMGSRLPLLRWAGRCTQVHRQPQTEL